MKTLSDSRNVLAICGNRGERSPLGDDIIRISFAGSAEVFANKNLRVTQTSG
jgi:hypothetical protein